jgi:hypothetical protein
MLKYAGSTDLGDRTTVVLREAIISLCKEAREICLEIYLKKLKTWK